VEKRGGRAVALLKRGVSLIMDSGCTKRIYLDKLRALSKKQRAEAYSESGFPTPEPQVMKIEDVT